MRLSELMTPQVQMIQETASIEDAAKLMKEHDIGALPVFNEDRLVGMITDRDIVIRGVAEGTDPMIDQVGQIMSPGVKWCYEDQELEDAVDVMKAEQIRRLVILGLHGRVVGIVSLRNIAHASDNPLLESEVLEGVTQHA